MEPFILNVLRMNPERGHRLQRKKGRFCRTSSEHPWKGMWAGPWRGRHTVLRLPTMQRSAAKWVQLHTNITSRINNQVGCLRASSRDPESISGWLQVPRPVFMGNRVYTDNQASCKSFFTLRSIFSSLFWLSIYVRLCQICCSQRISTKFDDTPENLGAWLSSFFNATIGLGLSYSEELGLLVKWLGKGLSSLVFLQDAKQNSESSVAFSWRQ